MVTRIIVVLLVSLVHNTLGQAQQPKKVARVGFVSLGFPPPQSAPQHRYAEAFYQGLRDVGHTVGKNVIIEYRYSEGNSKLARELIAELVSSKVDLIVAPTTAAIEAAKKPTIRIPIVMMSVGDPVSAEYIDSLPRPGGNITGVTGNIPALSGKLLQRTASGSGLAMQHPYKDFVVYLR